MPDKALYKYSVNIHSVVLSCVTVCSCKRLQYVVSLRYVSDVNKYGIMITTDLTYLFSERELTFTFAICYRPSVCLSSVTFVHPTQAVQIFGNFSTALGTLSIH